MLLRTFQREGIDTRLAAQVKRVESDGATKVLVLESRDEISIVTADAILIGTGRQPNLEGLNLEAAGVRSTPQGVDVDDRLRTSNRRIYAAGDVCLREKFTHTADASARIAVQNALLPLRKRWSNVVVPWCTYTDPEIAHTGLYEHEARRRGIDVQTLHVPLSEVDRAVTDGQTEGFAKIHVKRGGRILGATIVAAHAGELITLLTLAIQRRVKLQKLSDLVFPYPTQSEAVKKAADDFVRGTIRPPLVKWIRRWLWLRR